MSIAGRPKQVPLEEPNAELAQLVRVVDVLHAFGHERDAEIRAHRRHRAHDRSPRAIAMHAARQPHVDLHQVRLAIRQQMQSAVHRAEIVDGGDDAFALR